VRKTYTKQILSNLQSLPICSNAGYYFVAQLSYCVVCNKQKSHTKFREENCVVTMLFCITER